MAQKFTSNTAVTWSAESTGASPNPTTLVVSGMAGNITHISVRILGINHDSPSDIQMVLVSPTGVAVAIHGDDFSNDATFPGPLRNYVLDDYAEATASTLVISDNIVLRPLSSSSPSTLPDAPSAPYLLGLDNFNGIDPNGTWTLYTDDFLAGDGGSMSGWELEILTDSGSRQNHTFDFGAIDIPDGETSPYPITTTVSGITAGTVENVTIKFVNFTHTFPGDLKIMLESPSGRNSVFWTFSSPTLETETFDPMTFTLDDESSVGFTNTVVPVDGSGVYHTLEDSSATWDADMPSPAPVRDDTYDFRLAPFALENDPNGQWKLYISDTAGGDTGSVENIQLIIMATGSDTNEYNEIASGGAEGAGSADQLLNHFPAVFGGGILSGQAVEEETEAGVQGGGSVGGSSDIQLIYSYVTSGGIRVGGNTEEEADELTDAERIALARRNCDGMVFCARAYVAKITVCGSPLVENVDRFCDYYLEKKKRRR